MKVIIEIDDKLYKDIQTIGIPIGKIDYVLNAIKNGTPLPEGHGRLIDADALKKDDEVTIWRTRDSLRTGKTLKFFSELFVRKIEDAPTIIEAESEEQE